MKLNKYQKKHTQIKLHPDTSQTNHWKPMVKREILKSQKKKKKVNHIQRKKIKQKRITTNWVGLWRKLSTEKLMLLNCGVGEDSWESLGLQGDPTSPS